MSASGLSAVFEALRADDLEAFRALIDRAPELARAIDEAGVNALMLAARFDRSEQAGLLLAAGADLEVRDHVHESTALGWAAYYGSVAVAELLLDAGAKSDCSNRYGLTPAQIAEGGARGEHVDDAPDRSLADFETIRERIAVWRSRDRAPTKT